jgi:hypothetical protein
MVRRVRDRPQAREEGGKVTPLISILIPAVRPEKAQRAANAALANAGVPGDLVFEVTWEEDVNRIGCPHMLSQLVERAQGNIICFLGDDTIPEPGWLAEALETMATMPDGWGLVGLNTENSVPFAHWIADRRMLDLLPDRQFFNHAYQHNFCDRELYDIAVVHGRWAWCEKAKIKHDHPVTGAEADEFNQFAAERFQADQKTYWRRKRERLGKLAIGHPLIDETVPAVFYESYVCMEKPESFVYLKPAFPHGEWGRSISAARNSIVLQALEEGCSRLFMLDTDQVYPPDTLTKLMSHGLDVCGVLVHKRWPPFTPHMARGELHKYIQVPEAEMFSGDLVEVDATGTGALLYDMSIFDRIPYPWFEEKIDQGRPVGEDIWFCHQARKAGVRIFVDTSIKVGHYTHHIIGREFYEYFKAVMRGKHHV